MTLTRALRSGCCFPSTVFRFPCKRYSASRSSSATSWRLARKPSERSSSANRRVLVHDHRSGDSGSPRAIGSTKASNAASNSGCVSKWPWWNVGQRPQSCCHDPRRLGSRRHRLRCGRPGWPGVRRLPFPTPFVPDAGWTLGNRSVDVAGTRLALETGTHGPLLAPTASRSDGGRGQNAESRPATTSCCCGPGPHALRRDRDGWPFGCSAGCSGRGHFIASISIGKNSSR